MLWAVFFLHALWAVPKVEAYDAGDSFKQRLAKFAKTFDWLGGVLTLFGTGMLAAGITYVPRLAVTCRSVNRSLIPSLIVLAQLMDGHRRRRYA